MACAECLSVKLYTAAPHFLFLISAVSAVLSPPSCGRNPRYPSSSLCWAESRTCPITYHNTNVTSSDRAVLRQLTCASFLISISPAFLLSLLSRAAFTALSSLLRLGESLRHCPAHLRTLENTCGTDQDVAPAVAHHQHGLARGERKVVQSRLPTSNQTGQFHHEIPFSSALRPARRWASTFLMFLIN